KDQLEFSDKTYRNTMNNGKISWEKLSASLGCEVAKEAEILTDERRKTMIEQQHYLSEKDLTMT
ncbi:MAG TPA: hypothetical protein H9829_02195, partial [Candidatus Tetragenococcus pullicola]|nr:hypothetical protein [Candidatus Tetragenococcus pullicola]